MWNQNIAVATYGACWTISPCSNDIMKAPIRIKNVAGAAVLTLEICSI
jgi:hypothetical protein